MPTHVRDEAKKLRRRLCELPMIYGGICETVCQQCQSPCTPGRDLLRLLDLPQPAEYGMAMPCIRLEDKLNRLKALTRNGNQQVADESIDDTLMDLANYAIMTLVERKAANDD